MSTDDTKDTAAAGPGLSEGLGPAAWAVTAFGRVQKLVVREDVADELACKWRERDPDATAVPLYTWAAVEAVQAAERERCAKVCEEVHADTSECPEMALHCAARIRGA